MYTNKLVVVEFLDKDEVACGDEYVVSSLDEGVLACFDNNDKDDFYVNFLYS